MWSKWDEFCGYVKGIFDGMGGKRIDAELICYGTHDEVENILPQ